MFGATAATFSVGFFVAWGVSNEVCSVTIGAFRAFLTTLVSLSEIVATDAILAVSVSFSSRRFVSLHRMCVSCFLTGFLCGVEWLHIVVFFCVFSCDFIFCPQVFSRPN